MSQQLDELFSPERLRKNWEKKKKNTPLETLKTKNEEMSSFEALASSLHEHFHGENLTALNILMDDLGAVWESLFAEDTGGINPDADKEEMTAKAHDLLNRIEDLSFAFSLNKNSRPS